MSFFICTHQRQFHIEITGNVEVFGSSRRPSRSTLTTLEMQALYISKLLLESRAYTAITMVVTKRIAEHLSSKFHDLLMLRKCSETNNVANPDLLP